MRLLKRLLEGPARTMSQNYRDTSQDYHDLMKVMKRRFDQPEVVINSLNRKLRELPGPKRETASELRDFHNKIDAVCRQLRSAGCDVEHRSYSDQLLNKLSPQLLLYVKDKQMLTPPIEWNTRKLLDVIEDYVLRIEYIHNTTDGRSGGSSGDHNNKLDPPKRVYATNKLDPGYEAEDDASSTTSEVTAESTPVPIQVHVHMDGNGVTKSFARRAPQGDGFKGRSPNHGRDNAQPRQVRHCIFCRSTTHATTRCKRVGNWKDRLAFLKKERRCFLCMSDKHPHECRGKDRTCYLCEAKGRQEKHHPVLCKQSFPAPADKLYKPQAQPSTNKVMTLQEEQEDDIPQSVEDETRPIVEPISGSVSDHGFSDTEDEMCYNLKEADHGQPSSDQPEATRTLLMTTEVNVSNPSVPGDQLRCPILFDTASTNTLITQDLANKLNLPIKRKKMSTFHSFGDAGKGRKMSAWTVDLEIHKQDGTSITVRAEAVETLCALMPMVASVPTMLSEVKAKAHLPFPVVNKAPEILIGADYLSKFDIVHKEELANGFHLYDSSVGPLVYGKGKVSWKKGTQAPQQVNMIYRLTIEEQALPEAQGLYTVLEKDQLLAATEKLWSVEALGIEAPESTQEADAVLQNHKDTLKRLPDGRYEVAFPLREAISGLLTSGASPRSILPDNQKAAFARLFSVWRTYLEDNPQLRNAYSKAFAEQLEKGIIEIVEDHKLDPNKLYHYLAHHPVFREDKPTKLRIVFDGSARSGPDARSLNDCLHPGPSMLESLVGILLSCRLTSLLIIGDIEKAFLQISVRPEDRDLTRFLWLKDPSKRPSSDNLIVYRYCRVPFGLNASPFLLLATIDYHLNKLDTPLAKEIRANTYSDNIFLMAHTTEEAVEKYKGTKAAFGSASMNVREFISNCPEFNRTIPEVDQAKETKEKTLGHHWDSRRDVWEFALPDPCPHKLNKPTKAAQAPQDELALVSSESDHVVMLSRKAKSAKFLTKRVMLSVIHSLWDPLGLLAPVTLQARFLYQSLWDDKDLNWDDPVPEAVAQTWEELTSSWLNAKFEVPRFLFKRGSPRSAQLHVFADASDQAYGAVAYLRIVSETGSTYCMLVFGKNRMVTKKPKMTIPRKELMAATVGCRIIRFLRSKMVPELMRLHKLDTIPTYLWSDNQGVLFWIKDSDHFYGRFVQNRLEEIRKTADVKFRYVPTKDNPADVLSRGATVDELKCHSLWWTASPWLVEEEKQWPQQPANFQPFTVDLLGLDAKPLKEIMSFHIRKKQDQPSESLLDMVRNKLDKKVRTYPRVRRVTVHILRFCALMLKKVGREYQQPYLKHFTQAGTDRVREDNMLYLFRYNAAELALVKSEQLHHPPTKDQRALFRIETFPDGLLRCHGRLDHSGLPQNTIYPMWLPEGTWLTRYVVHTLHVMHAHAAVETTLALLRRRFWLVKGRRNISTIIRKNCVGCRIAHGPAFRIPEYAKLPAERLRECRPFAHIGLDLFGPFQVRMGSAPAPEPEAEPMRPRRGPKPQRHRQAQPSNLQKVWGVIFTCMATRAVHLEVVHSQSAEHLLQAFDMFMSRRGMPKSVTSDNAPSIMLVNRTVDLMWKQTLTDPATAAYCRDHGVAWHYITPESPWQGGFYERLIRSVKHSLSSAIGRNKLHFSHFVQVLTRVEHTINCRPITAQSQGDIDQLPLRPIDFLQPMAEYSYAFGPSAVDPDDEDYHNRLHPEERLHELFRKLQAQLDKFWDRWRTEYLLSLRETQRVLNQSGRIDRAPQVGEFVFVDDEELMPRSMWNIARVVELIPGRDGTVRHVRLRYPGGAESTRSVEMLHPLELRLSASESTEEATVRQDQQ